MRYLLIFFIISNSIAGTIKFLPPKERYQQSEKIEDRVTFSQSSIQKDYVSLVEKLKKENKKISNLVARQKKLLAHQSNTIDDTVRYDFLTGTRLKGTLVNSIKSTNLSSSITIKVDKNQRIKEGARFECSGTTKHRRVVVVCNLLIIDEYNEEFEVSTILEETDGSDGLRPDITYDGKDLYIASLFANSFAAGFLDASKQRVVRDGVEVVKQSMANKLLGGTIGALSEANRFVSDALKSQSKEPKLFINPGKKVFVYFKRRFKI